MDLVTLPEEFFVSAPPGYGQFQAIKTTLAEWTRITPPAQIDMPGEYSIYNLFGLALPFYLFKVTRPFGFWGSIRKTLAPDSLTEIHAENRRDIIALFFAVPWQVVLFLTGMMIVMKQWSHAGTLAVLLVPLSAGLYWFWYRHLSEEVEVE